MIVAMALALWMVGAAALLLMGWDADAAPWRIVGAGSAGLAMVAAITVGRSRLLPQANVVAMLITLAIAVCLPPPVGGMAAGIGLVLAAGAVLTAFYTLQLSLRTHAVAGSVLQHGSMRISGTVAVAATVAIAVVVALHAGSGAVSPRWRQSLDAGSGQFLVAVAVLLLALITGLSMLAVARAHTGMGEASNDVLATDSTGSGAG